MTRDIMAMTPAELRGAIARARGIDSKRMADGYLYPDWPSNIGEAWELESEIPEPDYERYAKYLEYVVGHDTTTLFQIGSNGKAHVHSYFLIHATAEQRSRAWLMWKEGEKNE